MADEIVSGGAETPTSTSAPTPSAATPAASASSVATPQTPPAGAIASPTEDRSTWVPPHRLRETRDSAIRQANQEFAQREATMRAEAQRYRDQVLALTGVTPPPNPEIQAVKDQFGSLYPGLAKMESRAAQLEQLLERAGDLEAQNGHYWESYGRQTMGKLFDHATTSMGAPLTDTAKAQLHTAFIGYVQSSPDRTARYASDPSIVEDFWKDFTSSFIDPVRRNASATVAGRAATQTPQDMPGGMPRSMPVTGPKTLDERVAAGWAQYNMPKG
jgi:hypothetical protein